MHSLFVLWTTIALASPAPANLTADALVYAAACKFGHEESCNSLAVYSVFFQTGTDGERRFDKEPTKAVGLLEVACEGGSPLACDVLANMLLAGEGVEPDAARAAQLLEKNCHPTRSSSCAVLAKLLAKGEGVKQDLPRAKALAEEACRRGVNFACSMEIPEAPGPVSGP
jgi:uncharacterized protein